MTNTNKVSVKKYIPLGILVISLLVTLVVISRVVASFTSANSGSSSVDRVNIVAAKAIAPINQEFIFPLLDSSEKKITEIRFQVDTAELRDEIIVKGQRATAVQGRTFLILNVKMTSSFTKGLQINSKDYLRLSMNGNTEDLLAPDIHNDPVIVEPISTKLTRVGWPINDTDKNLILHVGEVGGQKTPIELSF